MQILVQTAAALALLARRPPSLLNTALPHPVRDDVAPGTVRF